MEKRREEEFSVGFSGSAALRALAPQQLPAR